MKKRSSSHLFDYPLAFAKKGYRMKTRLVGRKLYTPFNKSWGACEDGSRYL